MTAIHKAGEQKVQTEHSGERRGSRSTLQMALDYSNEVVQEKREPDRETVEPQSRDDRGATEFRKMKNILTHVPSKRPIEEVDWSTSPSDSSVASENDEATEAVVQISDIDQATDSSATPNPHWPRPARRQSSTSNSPSTPTPAPKRAKKDTKEPSLDKAIMDLVEVMTQRQQQQQQQRQQLQQQEEIEFTKFESRVKALEGEYRHLQEAVFSTI